MNTMRLFTVLSLVTFFLAGCATTSSIDVIDSSAIDSDFSIGKVTAKNATGEIFDINIETMLVEAAMAELNERELFSGKENDLVLAISIVQYKKGDAFKRWLMPGMGKTVLSVEASLSNEAGKTLAQSQATKSVGAGGGYTIGAWKRVFEDVSEALIADLMSVR